MSAATGGGAEKFVEAIKVVLDSLEILIHTLGGLFKAQCPPDLCFYFELRADEIAAKGLAAQMRQQCREFVRGQDVCGCAISGRD